MSAELIAKFDFGPSVGLDPSNKEDFFLGEEKRSLRNFENREHHPKNSLSCATNLFFGFFFDGTRNNYGKSFTAKDDSETNVARLYSAHPGLSVEGVLPEKTKWDDEVNYKNFFRVYVPGVGTPFEDVKDTGKGTDATFGAATALFGERRIIWALIQAINCVHRFFHQDANLIRSDRALSLCRELQLGWSYLQAEPGDGSPRGDVRAANKRKIQSLLEELRQAIEKHIPDPVTGKPAVIDPGKVGRIFISTFGFSRGAAEARVFANWFIDLCRMDARLNGRAGLTLGGFPVTFDFLGLFDTVASVGLAQSALFTDGHAAWADAEGSLRIPAEVSQCLHLVSAHEVRRSFPLDSVHTGASLPSNCEEIVFPGVHSDVGGGYLPGEQGRGEDATGSDMLSRIALATMYRAARLAGTPLKLENARASVKRNFSIAPSLIAVFNAYLDECKTRSGTLTELMREQRSYYIRWRKLVKGQLASLASTKRSKPEDRADLLSADEGFVKEVAQFERWRKQKDETPSPFDDRPAHNYSPSFDSHHIEEWQRIDEYWDQPAPSPAQQALFENYVHDSFAWFKIFGIEAEKLEEEMRRLIELDEADKWDREYGDHASGRLTFEQKKWVERYRRSGEYPPAMTEGRELAQFGAGYLRYRRIYGGADNALLTRRDRQQIRNPELA